MQSDGKVLVGGSLTLEETEDSPALHRLLADGTIDPSFRSMARRDLFVGAIAIQPDGKLLVGGIWPDPEWESDVQRLRRVGLRRLHSDGSVDSSFQVPFEGSTKVPIEVTHVAIEPTDLVQWRPLVDVAGTGLSTQFESSVEVSPGARAFYRAVLK